MTSALLSTPFLTKIDPQADIKGSRDPLGVQTIWSRLGRQVVGNLTTVSTSVRDFTTLILGYYFAERVEAETSETDRLATFLRWEQLAAYARGTVNNDWKFRGTDRAQRNISEGPKVRLGTDASAQILSNQKTYGLWGLYTVPARSSGLLQGEPTIVTDQARELIEKVYLPSLTRSGFRNGLPIIQRLAKARTELDTGKADRELVKAVAKVLAPTLTEVERAFYREHLLLGGPEDRTGGGQAVLAEAMLATLDDPAWELSAARIRHLAKRCRTRGEIGERVAAGLEHIRTSERLLAPSAALFALLLGSDGQTVAEVAKVVKREWGGRMDTVEPEAVAALEAEFRDSEQSQESGRRWVACAAALASGGYERAIQLLIEQNRAVMRLRGNSAPWIEISDGRLKVRLREDATTALPTRAELPEYWRHSYFVDSLRAIAVQIGS